MKIKINLTSGILFAIISIILIQLVPSQIAVPAFKTGGPSPRVIPYLVLYGMLICSIGLIVQSLIFKKDKVKYFDIKVEKASLIMIALMSLFGTLMIKLGFVVAVVVVLPMMLYAYGERKPLVYIFTLFGGISVYLLFINVFNISLPKIGG